MSSSTELVIGRFNKSCSGKAVRFQRVCLSLQASQGVCSISDATVSVTKGCDVPQASFIKQLIFFFSSTSSRRLVRTVHTLTPAALKQAQLWKLKQKVTSIFSVVFSLTSLSVGVCVCSFVALETICVSGWFVVWETWRQGETPPSSWRSNWTPLSCYKLR